jgi:hypothetical protein
MTTVVSHGGRIGQHAMANLRDPATAVQLAKRLLQSGAWRTVPKQGDDTDRATYLLRAKVPAALAVLPRVAVAAMTKQPPSPGCHWCWVQVLAALSFGEDPYPDRTDATWRSWAPRAGAARPATRATTQPRPPGPTWPSGNGRPTPPSLLPGGRWPGIAPR